MGKVVLIKPNFTYIPQYSFTIGLKFLNIFAEKVTVLGPSSRKITVIRIMLTTPLESLAWDKIYHPKYEGCLDIRKN